MREEEYRAFQQTRISEGQRELAHAMRALVARAVPAIYESIRAVPDSVFLEPSLFTFFARSEREVGLGLPQLLFGALPPDARPEVLEVDSDRRGRVFLPGLGYLLTDRPSAPLTLCYEPTTNACALTHKGVAIPFAFQVTSRLEGTNIELVTFEDPALRTRFFDTSFQPVEVEIDGRAERYRRSIETAFSLLREHFPTYHDAILAVTRRIVVFRADNVNAFATIAAHGVAFFNPRDEHDEVYFVDELVHQCGHILFNAMTVRRRDFLAMDPDSPLKALAPTEADGRLLYDAFHGLYTEDAMTECLRIFEERAVFPGSQAHELYGRLAFIARKFRVDLRNLSAAGVFTPLGQELYDRFSRRFERVRSERADLWAADLRGQPYNFDAALFARANPTRSRLRAG